MELLLFLQREQPSQLWLNPSKKGDQQSASYAGLHYRKR
jgi:hypothetical protein